MTIGIIDDRHRVLETFLCHLGGDSETYYGMGCLRLRYAESSPGIIATLAPFPLYNKCRRSNAMRLGDRVAEAHGGVCGKMHKRRPSEGGRTRQ